MPHLTVLEIGSSVILSLYNIQLARITSEFAHMEMVCTGQLFCLEALHMAIAGVPGARVQTTLEAR